MRKEEMINLRKEVDKLKASTAPKEGFHMAMDFDNGQVYIYPTKAAYQAAWDFQPLYLISRFYGGGWQDREMFLNWGQDWINNYLPAPVPVPMD